MSNGKKMLAAAVAAVLSGAGTARAVLVGQWIADNYTGGTWNDSSGMGNTATAVGTPASSAGTFNGHRGIDFAGGDGAAAMGYFTVPNSGSALLGANAMTLVAVFKTAAPNTSVGAQFWQKAGFIGNEQPGAVPDWGLSYGASQVAAGIGGPDTTILSGGNFSDGATHVAIQQWNSAGTLTLYVDGVQVAQNTTAPTAARTANAFPNFALGADVAAQNGDLHIFNGQVAELRMYNDADVNPAALTTSLRATYVPEPATAALLAAAGIGLLARCRRRAP